MCAFTRMSTRLFTLFVELLCVYLHFACLFCLVDRMRVCTGTPHVHIHIHTYMH